jgi:hypothetical protein
MVALRERFMGRGPSYPYVGLEDAIGLAQKMYDYAKRAPAAVDSVITEAWKYSATSSSGQKVLAALKAFGLVEDSPAASGKPSMKLTQRSIRILLDDQDSTERRDEIRKAALSPKWYEYCWKTWGKEMPPSMKSTLLIEHGFVDSTVEGFLRDYRKTMAFAGLLDSKIGLDEEESDTGPKIGDWVQYEIKGVLQMPEARRLTHIEKDEEHGIFGFVEGQKGGIPYKDLIKAEPPELGKQPKIQPPNLFAPPPLIHFSPAAPSKGSVKMQTETFALPEGVTGQVQWPAEMTKEAFDDFIYQIEGLKKRVERAVKKSPPTGAPTESEG